MSIMYFQIFIIYIIKCSMLGSLVCFSFHSYPMRAAVFSQLVFSSPPACSSLLRMTPVLFLPTWLALFPPSPLLSSLYLPLLVVLHIWMFLVWTNSIYVTISFVYTLIHEGTRYALGWVTQPCRENVVIVLAHTLLHSICNGTVWYWAQGQDCIALHKQLGLSVFQHTHYTKRACLYRALETLCMLISQFEASNLSLVTSLLSWPKVVWRKHEHTTSPAGASAQPSQTVS